VGRDFRKPKPLIEARIATVECLQVTVDVRSPADGLSQTLGPKPEGFIQCPVTRANGASHHDRKHRGEEPVNILDMRDVDPARFDGLNRELPITFKKPEGDDVTSPREQLVRLGSLNNCRDIHRRSARQREA
jgi:hypothetical protein